MSVKRVFAIIGIVVGCIAAFVGGVIGVMALMGKFKTPVVKPEKLYFENPEQVVVAQYKDNDGKDVIYSFNLKAENNSINHEVNVKECFIWFEKGVGEDLIQLCDKDGNLLKADSKKRYAVNCNETLYFKIKVFYEIYEYNSSMWGEDCKKLFIIQDGKYVLNESDEYDASLTYYTMQTYEEKYLSLDSESLINGKVVLRARTADDTVQTSQDQVVWIDRNVSSIFLDYGVIPSETNNPNKEQRINIGVDKEVEFNYVVNPEISMQPISKESKKIVELYYNDPKSEDFVLVNVENIKNTTKYSLHKIFDETKCYVDELTGELKLTFLSNEATNGVAHYFKLAIFPSYNARTDFLAKDNASSITNVERLQHMVSTDLYVQVVNTNVDRVTLSDGELNLNLFTDDNVIHLKNEDAEAMNLNVEMFAGNDLLDVRLDELDFKTIGSSMQNLNPKFVLKVNQEVDVKEINFVEYNEISFNKITKQLSLTNGTQTLNCLVNSTIQVGDYLIINSLTYEGAEYVCDNGEALVYNGDVAGSRIIKMLAVDSYLDFYVYDNGSYNLATDADIKYSVTTSGQHLNKNWQIIVEDISTEILEGEKTLVLGLLVANDEGKFNVENLFATKPVTINVQELHYNIINSSATLDLKATNDGFIPADTGKEFNHFVGITEGTYNTCVYVISEKEIFKNINGADVNVAIVDYVENLFYIDDKETTDITDDEKFYIVGYFEGGNFVNKVRTKDNSNVTKEIAENKLQMLQLKNVYDETTSDVVARVINGKDITREEVEILKEKTQKLYKTNITIKQNILIDDSVEFNVLVDGATDPSDNPTELYSKTTGHIITIKTPNVAEIITRICEYYGIVKADGEFDANYIFSNYPENARIKGQLIDEESNNALVITLDVGELLSSDVAVEIKFTNVFTETRTEETLYSFKIKNSAPENIVYNGKDIEDNPISITLSENQVNAPVVTAVISWEDNNYKYNWYINYGEEGQKEIKEIELNNATAKDLTGFQDEDFKIVQGITYGISNNAININGTSLDINSITDNTYLSVTIAGVTRYLKLNVIQNGFELKQNIIEIAGAEGNLKYSESGGIVSGVITYEYNDNSIYYDAFVLSDIKLTNINILYSNSQAGTIKLNETASDEDTFVFVYDIANTDDDLTILTIDKFEKEAGKFDWKFIRTDDLYAALSVTFRVATKTSKLDCSVKFTSGIEYEVNARAWGEDVKLYKDTSILLYDVKTDDSAFTVEPLIKIRNTSGKTITVENKEEDATIVYNKTLELSVLGEYKFVIKADGDVIQTLTFEVEPNIVVKQDTASDLILDSGSADVSTMLYDNIKLYNYKTTYVYGKDKDVENNNKIILYSTEYDIELDGTKTSILEDKTNDLKSSVTMQSKEGPKANEYYVFTDGTIKTAWMTNIGEVQEVNVVVSSGAYEVGTFTAIVKNNNKVVTYDLTIIDNVLNLKAMLDYVGKFLINGKSFNLTEIKWFDPNGHNNEPLGKGTSIPTLEKRYDGVSLSLTFKGIVNSEEKTLIFNGKTINDTELTINIIPFELEDSDNINKAYSENKFNLLKDVTIGSETIHGVYNAANIASYFDYIRVDSVKDANGNSLISSNLGYAYINGGHENGLTITFNKISDNNVKAFITYTVKYKDFENTYTYTKEITLWNYQALSMKYPENEAEDDEDKYLFVEEVVLSNGVKYENIQYEPVVIDSLEGYTINLKDVDGKNINRVTASNRINGSTSYEIESLVVLAYENTINFPAYVNGYGNIEIVVKDGKITFKNYSAQFSGLIVFRLTSTSGNYVDYFVRVTCLSNDTTISGNATGFINGEYSGNSITNIVSDYSGFKNKFGVDYDVLKVKMFLLNATVLADDNANYNTAVFEDTDLDNPIRYTCVNDKTLTINDYTTITLSLIYQDSANGYVYPIGILNLYLRPQLNLNPVVTSSTIGARYSLVNVDGIENGEFKYTIPANTSPIPLPTDFNVATTTDAEGNAVKHILNDKGELVTGIEGIEIDSNIIIRNQVTSAKVFTVFYASNTTPSYTIKVTYTLEPVDIKAGLTDTIGEFDKDLNKFDDTFVIDEDYYKQYFGTYQGNIKIGDAEFNVKNDYTFEVVTANGGNIIDGVSYEINSNNADEIKDGALVLTFEQGLSDIVKTINVKYINLNDPSKQNQTYTFNVKRGLFIETATGDDQGVNSAQRKTTEVVANAYTSKVGSTLGVTKSNINGVDNKNGVKYTFAGYTIYIKDKSGFINFEFNTIKDDAKGLADSNYNLNPSMIFSDSGSLSFVHMPKTKNIDVSFTISNDAGEFKTDASTVDTRTLYLTLAKTYQQVEATYLTKDATAENVAQNTPISNLQNYMFTVPSDIPSGLAISNNAGENNTIKLQLKKLDDGYIYTDFRGMGFTDPTNPNFINFTKDASAKANLTLNADNTQNIIFDNNVSANEKCIVYLDNIAGMPTAEYIFQIMADDKVDGFTFSTEGHPDTTTGASPVEYMSFVIREDKNANAEYSTGKLKIGTINDGLSKGVHVLNGSNWVFLPKAGTDNERKLPFTNVAVEIPANSQGTNSASSINCSYDVILEMDPYNNANWDIYINFHRPEGDYHLPDMVTINLNIHGTSGYILNNLTVVLFNTEIGPKHDDGRQGILGGESFDILNHEDYGLEKPEGVDNVTFELAYDLSMVGESGHAVNTPLSSFNLDADYETSNTLILFKDGILTTKTVGKNVDINLVFRVKIGDYYLNNVTYQIQLLRSIQFFFNGDQPVVDKDDKWSTNNVTSYTTNFVLTNVDGSDVETFADPADPGMKFSFNVIISNNKTNPINGITYYRNLLWELKDLCGTSPFVDIDIDPSQESLFEGILEVDETGITFLKDYSGELKLILIVNLLNEFNYTVSWTINISGILDIQPQIATDNGALPETGACKSGDEVKLLGNSLGGTTGLYLKDMEYIGDTNVFDDYINYDESGDHVLKATYQYAIVKYNPYDGLNNQQRFGKATVADRGGLTENNVVLKNTETDRTENVILPIVPTTGPEESYLVIYEVKINYLNNEELTYYVAYKVVNNLNISVTALKHGNGDDFDVDNINVNDRLVTGDDNVTTYLDLFKYSETYKDNATGDLYTVYLDSIATPQTYKVDIDFADSKKTDLTGETLTIHSGNAKQINVTYNGNTLTLEKQSSENYWVDENDDIINNASLFTLSFNNITEFAKFIYDIDGIVIKQPTVEYKFKVDHIAEGRWGIDLTTKEKKEEGGSFTSDTADLFKNKLEDAELIIIAKGSGQPIYTINKYDAQKETGFRLSAGIELTAKGKFKVSQLFAELNLKDLSAYKDYEVVGVYTGTWDSDNAWVNNGTPKGEPTSFAPQVKIQVPTGIDDGTIEYELKQVVYEKADGVSGGVNGICTIEDEFYVIYCSTGAAIYKMNLNDMAYAGYDIGKDTIVSLTGNSLDAKFIKFTNDDSTGEFKIDTDAKITEIDEQTTNIHSNDGSDNKFIYSDDVNDNEIKDNSITMLEKDLIAYKNLYPNQKYLAITYSVTFGGVQLQCSINYKLPSFSTVIAYQNSLDSNVGITSIYVPVYDEDGDMTYEAFTSHLSDVTNIVENGSNYTAEDGFIKNADEDYTGEIKLDKTAVDNYFNTHTTAKFLEIRYTITTRTENKSESMAFVIVVKKGDAPVVS